METHLEVAKMICHMGSHYSVRAYLPLECDPKQVEA